MSTKTSTLTIRGRVVNMAAQLQELLNCHRTRAVEVAIRTRWVLELAARAPLAPSKHVDYVADLAEWMGCTPTAGIQIAVRVFRELINPKSPWTSTPDLPFEYPGYIAGGRGAEYEPGDLIDSMAIQATLDTLRHERNIAAAAAVDGTWVWSDTDPNDINSLAEDALVTLTARQLRTLMERK